MVIWRGKFMRIKESLQINPIIVNNVSRKYLLLFFPKIYEMQYREAATIFYLFLNPVLSFAILCGSRK